MRSVILLPTYNERENIKSLIPEIFKFVPDCRVLVIDDNSPDGTADEVKKLRVFFPGLGLLFRDRKEGLGAAYKNGFREVIRDADAVSIIVTMDADGSHDPSSLPAMIDKARTGKVVVGSRYVEGGGVAQWEWWRRLLSAGGNIYARLLTGLAIRDLTAGFMVIPADWFRRVPHQELAAAGYAFLIELKYLLARSGAGFVEHPIVFKARRGGESKLSNQIIIEGLKTPLRIFFRRLWPKT